MNCILCNYEWASRVDNPKACPRCKRRFDYISLKTSVEAS